MKYILIALGIALLGFATITYFIGSASPTMSYEFWMPIIGGSFVLGGLLLVAGIIVLVVKSDRKDVNPK